MRVKIISDTRENWLERNINEFLETIEPQREGAESQVIDIKYTSVAMVYPDTEKTSSSEDSCIVYSAMILYKT